MKSIQAKLIAAISGIFLLSINALGGLTYWNNSLNGGKK